MKIAEAARAADRVQRSTPFKVVASAAVVAVAVGLLIWYVVTVVPPSIQLEDGGPPPDQAQATPREQAEAEAGAKSDLERTQRLLNDVFAQRKSTGSVAVGAAVLTGVVLLIIWLGVALTYLAIAVGAVLAWVLAMAVAWLASFAGLPYPEQFLAPGGGLARLLAGVAVLSAAFSALMAGLRLLFSAIPGPVAAIARNALAEAVRMKVSLVFIVMLILGLACLPGLLDPLTPLRYRVQNFLQYSTGGSFWIIAILTLLFSAATLSFEQRDRVIWQTMTKPVASWQYLLGKWLGVISLAAVLLTICGSAVFLFTEYLKSQPAQGESSAYEAAEQGVLLTEDRRILQFQVLQASVSTQPLPSFEPDDPEFAKIVEEFVKEQMKISPDFTGTAAEVQKVHDDLYKQSQQAYRSVDPGNSKRFRFTGLQKARDGDTPLVLRYRVDSGSNMPDQIYQLTFIVGGQPLMRPCGLGQVHIIDSLSPGIIDEQGNLDLVVINGDAYSRVANPQTISFPPGGLQVSYSVGGYQWNFVRVMVVLWVKLAFLSMLAIWASTFLSFPVACLVAFGAFLCAEGATFLGEAAKYYASGDNTGIGKGFDIVIQDIALFVSWLFKTYAGLSPTTNLVEGKLVSWGGVGGATILLGLWSLALYGLAVQTFRKRELAMYSGN